MEHNRVYRINDDDIDALRDHMCDQSVIDAYARWVAKVDQLDPLVRKVDEAFADVTLGEGTGLLEAKGIDDYAGEDELAQFRSRDEKTDWRRIDVETLNYCYSAPTFMNPRGFIFHLPAFLNAELNDKFSYGFIDRLIDANSLPSGWIELLDASQRDSIAAVFALIADHPNYFEHSEDIELAIKRLRENAG